MKKRFPDLFDDIFWIATRRAESKVNIYRSFKKREESYRSPLVKVS